MSNYSMSTWILPRNLSRTQDWVLLWFPGEAVAKLVNTLFCSQTHLQVPLKTLTTAPSRETGTFRERVIHLTCSRSIYLLLNKLKPQNALLFLLARKGDKLRCICITWTYLMQLLQDFTEFFWNLSCRKIQQERYWEDNREDTTGNLMQGSVTFSPSCRVPRRQGRGVENGFVWLVWSRGCCLDKSRFLYLLPGWAYKCKYLQLQMCPFIIE